MSKTVVGLFEDYEGATRLAAALETNGFAERDVSFVANHAANGEAHTAAERREQAQEDGVAAGTGIGAALGGGVGVALAFGVLAIPGIGPIIAAGPLVAAFAGAGVGAAAGGLVGALTASGVPEEDAGHFAEGVRRGGTLVSVTTDDDRAQTAADIMTRCGALDVKQRANLWAAQGYRRHDPGGAAYTPEELARERLAYAVTAPQVVPGPAGADAAALEPKHRPTVPERGRSAAASRENAGLGIDASAYDEDFRANFRAHYGRKEGAQYESYEPAYRYGYELAGSARYAGRDWGSVEGEARKTWEARSGGPWPEFRAAVHHGWGKVRGRS